ncbi:MAG: hypothetical protein AABZ29_09505 [Gemmatimonadota bacterium]
MLWVVLREQLRRIGPMLIALTAIAAALPVLSVRVLLGQGLAADSMLVLSAASSISPAFPMLAGFIGISVAVSAWQSDHLGGHVYALTLPIPRWHYALVRLAAALLLVVPALAGFALSATIVAAAIELPPGLHSYPLSLVVRFCASTIVAFSLFFAIASGSKKSSGWGLLALFAVVILDLAYQSASDSGYSPLFNLLLASRSPLSFFFGQWSLVDV